MTTKHIFILIIFAILYTACNDTGKSSESPAADTPTSFASDLAFLRQHDSVIVLKSSDSGAQLIVSPRYQAKVFTSTAQGPEGRSFGWINYDAFSGPPDQHMNAYGGENRFWLGPEGGPFSLFFAQGDSMVFNNWRTPAPIDTEAWSVSRRHSNAVDLRKEMQLVNYSGTKFAIVVDRRIEIMERSEIVSQLSVEVDTSLSVVGYHTYNQITNAGNNAWSVAGGMPCIWILDMFPPSPETIVVIPFKQLAATSQPVATTDYFGPIESDRIAYTDSVLLFRADGRSRGKLGLGPQRAKPIAGSYDPLNRILTITTFDIDPGGQYLNQEWNTSSDPFSGDAVNAYNDGPLEDGNQMGPFYEIESVSPAAALNPGETLKHRHSVYHFVGSEQSLDQLCIRLLGISVADMNSAFSKKRPD